ncbi:hypothetical protein GCM10028803_06780 [Larkinella knui]|uniref:DUF4249 domain-containing protein n=1 Tax=Larkinella knui TaxID=2025310 RepID=A0A3P1CKA1_9BACT|nr:DUF4249 domain-containing protein [Larkinella knui]RRB13648.1 DUF4249 domain-containing protein [Larkinella knui]
MKLVSLFITLVLATLLCQCVTPINPDVRTLAPTLVVDGLVTDQPGRSRVTLSLTADYTSTSLNYLVEKATVFVTDNTNQRTTFGEISPGYYQPDASWRGNSGQTYTLHIRLSDGREYQSKSERLKPVAPIDSIYVDYSQQLKLGTDSFDKGFDVSLDLKDPANPDDCYRWSWVHYEPLVYCGLIKILECPTCNTYTTYGLTCCNRCWDVIRYQNLINITSDNAINGNRISRRPILRAPFNSYQPYYVEIEQQSLTKEAFTYLSSLKDMVQNTGGIFDAAPALLVGNISSVSKSDELVLGYFGASAMIIRPLYIDRSKAPGTPDIILAPPPQPPPTSCAECVETPGRTQKAPKWWVF